MAVFTKESLIIPPPHLRGLIRWDQPPLFFVIIALGEIIQLVAMDIRFGADSVPIGAREMARNKESETEKLRHKNKMAEMKLAHRQQLQIELVKTFHHDPMFFWKCVIIGGSAFALVLKVFDTATDERTEDQRKKEWRKRMLAYAAGGLAGGYAYNSLKDAEEAYISGGKDWGTFMIKSANASLLALAIVIVINHSMGEGGDNPLKSLMGLVV